MLVRSETSAGMIAIRSHFRWSIVSRESFDGEVRASERRVIHHDQAEPLDIGKHVLLAPPRARPSAPTSSAVWTL